MTPQELKNSILQLAIQGKLVEQRPEEGTAEELYRQIQAENTRLIKTGVLKRAKYASVISNDDAPFDIPESWCWIRFSEIGQLLDGEKKSGESYPNLDAKFLRGKSEATILKGGKYVSKGTKLILVDGENSGEVFDAICDGYMGSTFKVLYYTSLVCDKYVRLFLLFHKADYRNNKKGSAIPHLNKDLFFNMPMPLPPLAEQKRIVAKIEELSPLIDRYEVAWSKLENFNKRFPEDMQKSILQMAIQGKLVPQDPSEGTGKALYKQIQAEKAKLIKEGKIKKEKPLPEISEDEIPFEIPDSWKWVRFQNITRAIGDGLHGTPVFSSNQTAFPFINGNNLEDKKIVIKPDTKFVEREEYEKYCISLSDKALLLSINGTIGNIAYYNCETIILGKSACYIDSFKSIVREYIELLLRTKYFLDYSASKATKTTISNLGLKAIRNCPIPLPPFAEQKRIVAKLEELLPLCERLK